MDAFFASVEQRDDPALQGRPVLVGGRGGRGVVAAASYEARRSGCRSAMPMAEALRRCPDAVVVKPSFARYEADSARIMEILETASPMVEPLSIDEAFIDVTGSERLLGAGPVIAKRLKASIREALGLTASVGVAPCKFVAKIASDLEKPDGLTIFESAGIAARLAPLPIERMWGVGPKSRARFEARAFNGSAISNDGHRSPSRLPSATPRRVFISSRTGSILVRWSEIGPPSRSGTNRPSGSTSGIPRRSRRSCSGTSSGSEPGFAVEGVRLGRSS